MANLGLSILEDAVEMTLQGMVSLLLVELYSLDVELLDVGDDCVEVKCRLSVLIFSGVLSVGGTG